MRPIALFLAASLMLPATALAQRPPVTPRPPAGPPDVTPDPPRRAARILGEVSIGDLAPDFELHGSRGRPVKLSSLRGDWLVLAFADRWQKLAGLQRVVAELRGLGARVAGVCHEKSRTIEAAAQRDSVTFLLMADATGQVSAMYGLFDYETSRAVPGFLVLDRKGIVRMAVAGQLLPPEDIARLARFAITGL